MEDAVFHSWIDSLKDADMEDICDAIGVEVKHISGHKQVICPFHDDKSFGSCFITKNNYLHCFACGANADTIKLVQQVESSSFYEACCRISNIAGIPIPEHKAEEIVKRMPFALDGKIRSKQLDLLGLRNMVSAFIAENHTDNPIEKRNWPDMDLSLMKETLTDQGIASVTAAVQPSTDGYTLGFYAKYSLQQLFDEDEITFNQIVIGKLVYRLFELMNYYHHTVFTTYEIQQGIENDIDCLLPLAAYYKKAAPYYGFDLSFIDFYQKRPLPEKKISKYQVMF